MTVKANDIMPPTGSNGRYSLFLPRFVELRLDKTVADSLQRVKDQKEAAKEAAILGKKAA
jgi:DNA ligase-1